MKNNLRVFFFFFFFLAVACVAQVSLNAPDTALPHIGNAKLETVNAAGVLQQQIEGLAARQSGTAWIAYAVPAVPSNRTMCCSDGGWGDRGCCGTCHLDSDRNNYSGSRDDCDDVEQKSMAVFYRVEEKKVDSIRLFTENCSV